MKVADLVKELSLEVKSNEEGLSKDVSGCHISDLLSDVMGNGKKGDIWVTLQTHTNIVAVATLKELAGIIIVGKRQISDETLKKAESEKVVIMTTSMPAFEVAGRIYQLLKK